MVLELTSKNFDKEVFDSKLPVLVDFWAPWCGPCKAIAPFVEELSKEKEGKIKICKINVDQEPEIANRFMIMSIPTLVIFKNGQIVERRVGSLSKRDLEKLVNPYI